MVGVLAHEQAGQQPHQRPGVRAVERAAAAAARAAPAPPPPPPRRGGPRPAPRSPRRRRASPPCRPSRAGARSSPRARRRRRAGARDGSGTCPAGRWSVPWSAGTGATRTTGPSPSLAGRPGRAPRAARHRRPGLPGGVRADRAGHAEGDLLTAACRAPGARRPARDPPRPASPGGAAQDALHVADPLPPRPRPPVSGLASGAGAWRSSTRAPSAPVHAMTIAGGAAG